MSPAAQPQPLVLLAPQNDSVPSTGSGAAKKKNKKKKSAAARANAALAASSASPIEASEPASPTKDDITEDAKDDAKDDTKDDTKADTTTTDNGNDEPVVDDQTGDSTTKGQPTPDGTATPSSPTKDDSVPAKANGHAQPPVDENETHSKSDSKSDANGIGNGNGNGNTSDRKKDTKADTKASDIPVQLRNGDGPTEPPTSTATATATAKANANANANAKTTAATTNTYTAQPSDDAMAEDDESLRAEVDRLRKQVAELDKAQAEHKEEVEQLKADLEESEAGREQAETQYQILLARVEKIKETLGERLKRDRQELEEAKDRIDELEDQNATLREGGAAAEKAAAAAEAQVQRLQKELDEMEREHERETNAMRGRAQLSQQNWQREKADLERGLQQLRKELEEANMTMGEWEVIALEERSVRGTLAEKAADLEEQLAAAVEQSERLARERATHTDAIEGLQRALAEIQETRKMELRDMVSESEAKLGAAEQRAQAAEAQAAEAVAKAAQLEKEVARTQPFEREVKEKNALIGKLRHEAIALNDHLTRALRYIKKNRPEDSVDKQVVTNLLLQFLSLDRSDPKKFQVLQVIAGMLYWTDEQKEKAGLARPGAAGSSSSISMMRMPSSPFARTPSTAALHMEFFADGPGSGSSGGGSGSGGGGTRESLSELWTSFLERSVDEAASDASNPSSHKGSVTPAVPEKP